MTIRTVVISAHDTAVTRAVDTLTRHGSSVTPLRSPAPGQRRYQIRTPDPAPRRAPAKPLELTPRQFEVLQLIAEDGLSGAEIAARLGLAPTSARTHVKGLLKRLGVHTRCEAVAAAARNGWLP